MNGPACPHCDSPMFALPGQLSNIGWICLCPKAEEIRAQKRGDSVAGKAEAENPPATTSDAELIVSECKRRGFRVVTAESLTGGLISAELTGVPGASEVLYGAYITYTHAAKERMIGVRSDTLDTYGAVSAETAREMAEGALSESRADFAVAVTGVAGPGPGADGVPAGTVYVAVGSWWTPGPPYVEQYAFRDMGRAGVRAATVSAALELLLSTVRACPVRTESLR